MTINVTPIPRVIDLAVPSFTLGTSNVAGDAQTAVASNSTLLTFDATLPDAITFGQSGSAGSATVTSRRDHAHAMAAAFDSTLPDAITFGQSGAAGSATVAARRDHAHAMESETPLLSNIVTFSRSASAGSGAQAVSGCGFQPTTLIVLAIKNSSEEISWGLGDDDVNEADVFSTTSANYSRGDTNIIQLSNASGNDMVALLSSLDSDGFTVTWTKSGTGLDADVKVLCMR